MPQSVELVTQILLGSVWQQLAGVRSLFLHGFPRMNSGYWNWWQVALLAVASGQPSVGRYRIVFQI